MQQGINDSSKTSFPSNSLDIITPVVVKAIPIIEPIALGSATTYSLLQLAYPSNRNMMHLVLIYALINYRNKESRTIHFSVPTGIIDNELISFDKISIIVNCMLWFAVLYSVLGNYTALSYHNK
jgi:hypothetical protein